MKNLFLFFGKFANRNPVSVSAIAETETAQLQILSNVARNEHYPTQDVMFMLCLALDNVHFVQHLIIFGVGHFTFEMFKMKCGHVALRTVFGSSFSNEVRAEFPKTFRIEKCFWKFFVQWSSWNSKSASLEPNVWAPRARVVRTHQLFPSSFGRVPRLAIANLMPCFWMRSAASMCRQFANY